MRISIRLVFATSLFSALTACTSESSSRGQQTDTDDSTLTDSEMPDGASTSSTTSATGSTSSSTASTSLESTSGSAEGYRISHTEGGGVVHAFGLRDGDVIRRVNGAPVMTFLEQPPSLLSLTQADHIRLRVRRGKNMLQFDYALPD